MIARGLVMSALMLGGAANAQQGGPAAMPAATVQIAGPVLMVTDLERSLKFYIEGLGLAMGSKLPAPPGPGATVTAAAGSSAPFLLLRQRGATPAKDAGIAQGDGLSRVMLLVPDSAAVAARLDRAGYAHTPVNDRHVFFVTDPDGYRYEIMQRNSRH